MAKGSRSDTDDQIAGVRRDAGTKVTANRHRRIAHLSQKGGRRQRSTQTDTDESLIG